MMPHTLNATQVSVEVARHTVSLMRRQAQEEHPPAHGELLPAVFVQLKGLGKDIFYEKPIEREAAQQQAPKKP